jgi:hypothetical protein
MSRTANALVDCILVFGGFGLSTLFIATDGNGQDPVPVAAEMLFVVAVTGAVSFALASIVRTAPLAILASMVVTELVFLLYFVSRIALSAQVYEHPFEELNLLPFVFAVMTAPIILLSSIGFGRVASRAFRRQRAEQYAGPKSGGE